MEIDFHYEKHHFDIEITETAIKSVNTTKFDDVSKSAFKIYIIKCENDFIYIGITKTYLSERFRLGFNSTKKVGHNGYHGYKWVKSHKGKHLKLIIITFKNITDKELIETIEAELVFKVREKFKKWPECQNEIHFYNKGKEVIEFSENLFKELTSSDKH